MAENKAIKVVFGPIQFRKESSTEISDEASSSARHQSNLSEVYSTESNSQSQENLENVRKNLEEHQEWIALRNINPSIQNFSIISSKLIKAFKNVNVKLEYLIEKNFPIVRQDPPSGDVCAISSLLITAIILISRLPWGKIPKNAKSNLLNNLTKLLPKFKEIRTLCEKIMKRCEQLMKEKDRIMEGFATSEYIVVHDMRSKPRVEKRDLEESEKSFSIFVRSDGVVFIVEKPWGRYKDTTKITIVEFILAKINSMFKDSILELKASHKILKGLNFTKLNKITLLRLTSQKDAETLKETTKELENKLMLMLESAAFVKVKFNFMYGLKKSIKNLKQNPQEWPVLSQKFTSFECLIEDRKFRKYIMEECIVRM